MGNPTRPICFELAVMIALILTSGLASAQEKKTDARKIDCSTLDPMAARKLALLKKPSLPDRGK